MTARELAEKLEDMKRRYTGLIAEARQKEARATIVVEEATRLGISADGFRRDLSAPDYRQPVRHDAFKEAYALFEAYLFGDKEDDT